METITKTKTSQKGFKLSDYYNEIKRMKLFNSIHDERSNTTIIMSEVNRATIDIVSEFKEFVIKKIDEKKYNFIIDLDNVYFIDSTFFGALVHILKRVNKENGYLKLVINFENKPQLLNINRLEEIFDIYPNLFEALKD